MVSVLILILDTLRYDYAHKLPAFCELAEKGWEFERMYGGSTFTYPNLCTLRSGLYPPRHGWRSWPCGGPFEASHTLERCLQGAGYHLANTMKVPPGKDVHQVERPSQEPFFRFIWYTGIHDAIFGQTTRMPTPGVPLEEYERTLAPTNKFLAKTMKGYDDCLTLIMGDHGVGLEGERLRGEGFDVGAGQVYDFRIRVPCILVGPMVKPKVIEGAWSMADLMPIILDLLDLPIPKGLDGTACRQGPVYLEAQSPHSIWPSKEPNVFGATNGKIKVMVTPDGPLCFDLAEGEQRHRTDLLETDEVQEMLEFIDGYRFLDS